MKKMFLALMFLLVVAGPVLAADVTLRWDAALDASSYKIQMSTDQGVTWAVERPVPTGTTFTWIGAPDTGLILFRAVSVNSVGIAIRTEAGAWFNGAWKPPAIPGGLGAQ